MTETQKPNSLLRDYGSTVVIAVVVALVIRFFLIEAYRIPSAAMKPSLEPGDTIFVEKWPFGLHLPGIDGAITKGRSPAYGEIVVFTSEEQKRDYIKRVVGLPGDTVQVKDGHLILNGRNTEVNSHRQASCGAEELPTKKSFSVCWEAPMMANFGPTKVPADSVFVLGDMRSEPVREPWADQTFKSWGIFPTNALKGSALWIWLSVDPTNRGSATGWFPSFRFDRMFKRVQ